MYELVADSGLAPQAAAAISVINNVAGSHAQFLLVLGAGEDKIVQMVQCDLSPVELWTFTTNPDERNARARVQTLHPNWPLVEVIAWLAEHYPLGLTGAGLVKIDEALLSYSGFQMRATTENVEARSQELGFVAKPVMTRAKS